MILASANAWLWVAIGIGMVALWSVGVFMWARALGLLNGLELGYERAAKMVCSKCAVGKKPELVTVQGMDSMLHLEGDYVPSTDSGALRCLCDAHRINEALFKLRYGGDA